MRGDHVECAAALQCAEVPHLRPEVAVDGIQVTLRPKTPILLVRQEIAPAAPAVAASAPILVSQSFFRLDDRFAYEGNEQRDKDVTRIFLDPTLDPVTGDVHGPILRLEALIN